MLALQFKRVYNCLDPFEAAPELPPLAAKDRRTGYAETGVLRPAYSRIINGGGDGPFYLFLSILL